MSYWKKRFMRVQRRVLLCTLLLAFPGAGWAIPWVEGTDAAFAQTERTGKPVLLLVTAGLWCDPCTWLEENTLSRSSVTSLIQAGFVPVRILDTDRGWDTWGVERLPTLIVLDPSREERARITGAVTAPVLQEKLAPFAASPGTLPTVRTPQTAYQPAAEQQAEQQAGRAISALEALRGAVFRIGSTGTLWNDGGANWYSQDAGLPPRLEEYDRDDTFLYLRDRGSATLLGIPLERIPRGTKSVLWRWDLEERNWGEVAELERLD